MIRYSSTDIIRRAKQLSDLENSDFISWNEELTLLNESYTKMYQAAIDRGDKNYVKSFTVSLPAGSDTPAYYALPAGFYQLYAIQTTIDCTPILRKSKNESSRALRYDIINGNLVLYGSMPIDLTVYYFPTPLSLTFPALSQSITLPDTSSTISILDCNQKRYLFDSYSAPTHTLTIYDIDSGAVIKTITVTIAGAVTCGWLGKKKIILYSSALSSYYYIDINSGNMTTITSSNYWAMKSDNEVYLLYYSTNYSIYSYTSTGSQVINASGIILPIQTWDKSVCHSFMSDYSYFALVYGNEIYVCPAASNDLPSGSYSSTGKVVEYVDNILYYSNNAGVYSESVLVLDANEYYNLIGINKIDPETGYGISAYNNDNEPYIFGCYADTQLDYPDRFYFVYIAYMMAIAYKSKQSADTSLLEVQAARAEDQFYDMLSPDDNEFQRITNVYPR
jgi:hypothetical protein